MPVPPARTPAPAGSAGAVQSNGAGPGLCVLILDVHRMVSTALRTALQGAGLDAHELAVSDHHTIMADAARHPAAVVLVELALGADPGGEPIRTIELIAALTGQGHRVLVVGEHLDTAAAAIAAGAIGALSKSVPLASLLATLAVAAAGRPLMTDADHDRWLARHHHDCQHAAQRARRLDRLTPREHQVLALMATGHRAAWIAEHFVVALPTVRTQIRSILLKLDVGSQLEAVALIYDTQRDRAR